MSGIVDPPSKLPSALIAPLMQAVDRQARLAVACWLATDERMKLNGDPRGAAGIPINFFIEVGAILQIKIWEDGGLLGNLSVPLPSSDEAKSVLHHRAMTAPQGFTAPDALHLSQEVLIAWVVHFAWAAPNIFQADFVVNAIEEDLLVDAIARLLWRHRHD